MNMDKITILIVDDDRDVMELVDNLLSTEGWNTIPVSSGEEAIQQLEQDPSIDILITDIKMPGIDGIKLMERIKEEEIDTEIIIMSAYSSLPAAISAVNLGADRYIQKPFTIDHMIATVKQVEDKIRLKRENEELLTELKQNNMELVKLSKIKDDFLSMVSHELKTPLAVIKDSAGIILENMAGPINEKQGKLLKAVDSSVIRLVGIVNNLLGLSTIESGKIQVYKEMIDITEIVRSILNELATRQFYHSINIENRLQKEGLYISADSALIKQVIYNVVENAMKYAGENGKISIEADYNDDTIVIRISDTGPGIKKEDQKRIFEKFEQVNTNTSFGNKGVGLGLAIVKKIVQIHQGNIGIESPITDEGKGARIIISLPVL
ncbi:response regulator [Elusimicrobiota bacterium]